jgi:tetratricopeptide (TPR) repeat protein
MPDRETIPPLLPPPAGPRAARAAASLLGLGLLLLACPAAERAAERAPPDARPPPGPCLERPTQIAVDDPAPKDPRAARAALERGAGLAEAGRWAEAEGAFRAALEADPGLGLAHLGVAEALAYTGGPPDARRAHLAAALVDLPRNPRAHARFGDALAATGDREGALRHLRCALDLKPSLRRARRRAAHLALEREGPEAAAELMAPLLAEGTETSDLLLAARVHTAAGDPGAAAQAMTSAARAAESAPLFRRAAALWTRAGKAGRADAAAARADALDPRPERELRELRPARVKRR